MPKKASGWSKAAAKEAAEEEVDTVALILAACKLMKGVGELF
jgi:hypothetical protein